MTPFRIIAPIFIALLLALPVTGVHAQDAAQLLTERYPPGSIDTTESANAALGEIPDARSAVDGFYSDQRVACYRRFFASSCLSDVRQKRRAAQSKIRKIEVEANALLRTEKAAERDRALAERDNRANQQPGSRSLPISGAARELAPEPEVTAPPPTPAEAPAETSAETPASSNP